MMTRLIIDAHLDLAMNAMEWNRDYTKSVEEIRSLESKLTDKADRGNGMVCFPELRKGNVGIVVATQIARYVTPDNPLPGWRSPEQAWAHTQGQLAWYRAMEDAGELRPITNLADLERHLTLWNDGAPNHDKPIGYILSLEGADSLTTVQHLERAYEYGLRAVGPAHFGPGRYAYGTGSRGGIGRPGRELLKEMERLNVILDTTHLCDESFWEALENFNGHVWASHSNTRALVNTERQFDDDQLKELIQRGAVVGVVLHAAMMVNGWTKGVSKPKTAGCFLHLAVDHIDHICQLAGNCSHVGIGSDLDGGFGKEESPADMETIADLQKIEILLQQKGYTSDHIDRITHGNWLGFLRRAWKK